MSDDLFTPHASTPTGSTRKPLAERLRPKLLDEVVGQGDIVGPEGSLTQAIAGGNLTNMIFWGAPGTGKTTVARLVAKQVKSRFQAINAMDVTAAQLRPLFAEARHYAGQGQTTLLFIDEIHRLTRTQQDAFLPVLEDGTLLFIGATTENPSFVLSSALLSRAQVLVFNPLGEDDLELLLQRAEYELEKPLPVTTEVREKLLNLADGDGRYLLGLAEILWNTAREGETLEWAQVEKRIQRRMPKYDRDKDGHYNLISALHKSIRASDPDAALYYFARMLEAGEDPRYIARRLVRTAAEDIGLASPAILQQAMAAQQAFVLLGSPEGELALAGLVVRLATAPKSNAVYMAYKAARKLAKEHGSLSPPLSLLNAPTPLMKELGYGEGYNYDHDSEDAFSGQNCWPEGLAPQLLYQPTGRGAEAEIRERLREWWEKRNIKK